ncbi:putative claudin-24 isoform X2 [Heterodontus francisci]|uniref:putative claudin-24 isoform X2 n=1 Tax=Heterodontus francisci TaxID=7792 RepID=UPI00355B8C2B
MLKPWKSGMCKRTQLEEHRDCRAGGDYRDFQLRVPEKSFTCKHSPRKEEQMSRGFSGFSQSALAGVSEVLSSDKEELIHTFIEPCITASSISGAAIDADRASGRHMDNKMRSRLCVCQHVGFSLSLVGWVCSLLATVLPQWLTMNTDLIMTETYSIGIWETCVAQDDGAVQCKGYDSLLNLPEDIQLTRILMCVSIALGLLGLLFSLSGSASITCFSDNEVTKGRLAVSGGAFFLLAGVTTFAPVSYMAHMTVVKFWDPTMPGFVPRWEFGPALFVGWVGGFLFLPGGLLLIVSQCCIRTPKGNIQLKLPLETPKRTSWYKTEYV